MIGYCEARLLVVIPEQHLVKLDDAVRAGKLCGEVLVRFQHIRYSKDPPDKVDMVVSSIKGSIV